MKKKLSVTDGPTDGPTNQQTERVVELHARD